VLFLPFFHLFLPFILLNSHLLYSFFQILSVPRLKACDDATQQSALCFAVILTLYIILHRRQSLGSWTYFRLMVEGMEVIIEIARQKKLIALP
jgi:hypothetical protein